LKQQQHQANKQQQASSSFCCSSRQAAASAAAAGKQQQQQQQQQQERSSSSCSSSKKHQVQKNPSQKAKTPLGEFATAHSFRKLKKCHSFSDAPEFWLSDSNRILLAFVQN
jgi:isochorismate synthase EntC